MFEKEYFERERHKGGVVERWAEHRISFFLSCCFQSSPVSMATSCRRQGDSSEKEGYPPSLKEDGQPVRVCVSACVSVRARSRVRANMYVCVIFVPESCGVTESCIAAHRCCVRNNQTNV